jgi:hypothetical protein
MSVTESERHQQFSWFEEHMGQERAATMMNLVPPVGWAEVATRHDLDELDGRLTTRIDALESKLDARFETLETRFEARFQALEYRFDATDGKFEALENRIVAKVETVRSELLRTFGTWLLLSQAAVIATISVVIALVALG